MVFIVSEDRLVYCSKCRVRGICKEALDLNIGILFDNKDISGENCLIKTVIEYINY